jgi:hypothetical protein
VVIHDAPGTCGIVCDVHVGLPASYSCGSRIAVVLKYVLHENDADVLVQRGHVRLDPLESGSEVGHRCRRCCVCSRLLSVPHILALSNRPSMCVYVCTSQSPPTAAASWLFICAPMSIQAMQCTSVWEHDCIDLDSRLQMSMFIWVLSSDDLSVQSSVLLLDFVTGTMDAIE